MFHLRTCLRYYANGGVPNIVKRAEALMPESPVLPRDYSSSRTGPFWGDRLELLAYAWEAGEWYGFMLFCNTGAVVGIKHATRVMKPVMRGAIVCTGSTASQLAGLGPHTYCVSKTALQGLVRSTALELRSYGIRVNMVSPDATATPMFQRVMENSTGEPYTLERTQERMSMRALLPNRPLTSGDVANAVLFLCSEEAGYVSGHNLLLDAARTVGLPVPAGFHHWFAGYSPMLK